MKRYDLADTPEAHLFVKVDCGRMVPPLPGSDEMSGKYEPDPLSLVVNEANPPSWKADAKALSAIAKEAIEAFENPKRRWMYEQWKKDLPVKKSPAKKKKGA